MTLYDSNGRYGWLSIALHWLGAAAIVTMFVTGQLFEDLQGAERLPGLKLHISLGIVALFVLIPRLLNRFANVASVRHPAPALMDKVAGLIHVLLILSITVLIVSGPLAVLANGRDIDVFGLLTIPALLPRMESVHEIAGSIHEVAVKVLVVSVILHVLGAVKHLVIDRDGVMKRMLVAGADR